MPLSSFALDNVTTPRFACWSLVGSLILLSFFFGGGAGVSGKLLLSELTLNVICLGNQFLCVFFACFSILQNFLSIIETSCSLIYAWSGAPVRANQLALAIVRLLAFLLADETQ